MFFLLLTVQCTHGVYTIVLLLFKCCCYLLYKCLTPSSIVSTGS